MFATRAHAGQRRADGSPFVLHPLEVAGLLSEAGAADQLVARAVLHDSGTPVLSVLRRASKLWHYEQSMVMLEDRLPGSPLVGALRPELDACRHDAERRASRLTPVA